MTTPTPRQLPGVKGQWILCSDCPPTEADGDADIDVRVYFQHAQADGHFCHFADVSPDQYWCPSDSKDHRPFTLPAEPTPKQTAAGPFALRQLHAAAYQALSAANAPIEMLDNLAAAANGQPLPHDPDVGLPWTPEQPAAVARKFVQVVPSRDGKAVFAVADDGTAWVSQEDRQEWRQVVPLPDREPS